MTEADRKAAQVAARKLRQEKKAARESSEALDTTEVKKVPAKPKKKLPTKKAMYKSVNMASSDDWWKKEQKKK
jgi:hypothetical protein